jgi:hypothetical protein
MKPTVPKVRRCENQRLELRNLAQYERAEHVWSALIVQTSTCSVIASASSTSMPRYLTVLSILVGK